jgi:phosphate-selective porin O/P
MTKATQPKIILITVVSIATLLLCGISYAQDKPDRPTKTKDRVQLLEDQVDKLDETINDVTGADAPDQLRKRLTELQSKLDEMTTKIGESEANDVASQEADQERDTRLDSVAEEISNLWKDVEETKATVDQLSKNPIAGHDDDGFFIGSTSGNFRLNIGGLFRPYYRIGMQKTWSTNPDGTLMRDEAGGALGGDVELTDGGFGLDNARLTVGAKVFDVVYGEIQLDYGTLNGKVAYPMAANMDKGAEYNRVEIDEHVLSILNAYGEYAPFEEFKVRLGQFKVPFDREGSVINKDGLTFTSRSLHTRQYNRWGEGIGINSDHLPYHWAYDTERGSSFDRDRGLMLHGSVEEAIFSYAVGVFNGGGSNLDNDNRDILIALRVATDPIGKMTPGMSDLDTVKDPLFSVGAGFGYDMPDRKSMIDPNVSYNSSDINVAGDAHFKWYGVSVLASVFYRNVDHGDVRNRVDSLGLTGQIAYFNDFTNLEPAFRYAAYDADTDYELSHVHEITGALNYYPFGKNLKIQVEYRGMFPANTTHSYFVPWGVWYDYRNEITLMGQVSF